MMKVEDINYSGRPRRKLLMRLSTSFPSALCKFDHGLKRGNLGRTAAITAVHHILLSTLITRTPGFPLPTPSPPPLVIIIILLPVTSLHLVAFWTSSTTLTHYSASLKI